MTELAVATIGAVGLVLAAMVQTLKRQNGREHAENAGRLDRVLEGIGRVEHKIDEHIREHD